MNTTIDYDLPCVHCEYNLRTLSYDGACPECGQPVASTLRRRILQTSTDRVSQPRPMGLFTKCCSILAAILAIALLILGFFGLFLSISAHFTLPPIVGVIPALVGWGILRSVWIAFRYKPVAALPRSPTAQPTRYHDPIPITAADLDQEIDRHNQ
ncbi:MAG: hypothetical protein ACHRHE_20890 [Tepidisphaerales bacterium]